MDAVKRGILRRMWELGYSISAAARASFTEAHNVRSLFIYWDLEDEAKKRPLGGMS